MAKTKISEFSATPGNNTDIDGINLAEGCAPSGINDAIRELMAQLKDFQAGTAGDSFNGPVGTTTAAAGAFTTLSSTGNTTLGDAAGDTVTVNGTATFANANPTLSAGTANGVAYLNGSKVLTTGSALTFDGTTLTGTSATSAANLVLNNTSGATQTYVNFTSGATVINAINRPNATNDFRFDANYGSIVWGIGSSGTASEQMRLTSTGLGIGTSSPNAKLEVFKDGAPAASGNMNTGMVVAAASGSYAINIGANATGAYTWLNSAFQNNSGTAAPMVFMTGATERARITSGGYFCASTSGSYLNTNTYNFNWSDSVRFIAYHSSSTAANAYGFESRYKSTPNGTGNEFLYCTDTDGTIVRATIRSNGGIANYSANNVNLSDRREKTNFAPAGEYLSKICAIPVQTFNYIDQNIEEDPGLTLGVVAQDVQAVAPELVMESNWGTEEEPKMRLSIYQTDLQYALMKCIQEQQAIINQINAKVEAQAAEIADLKGQA